MIVQAAIRYPDGSVYTGKRHYRAIMNAKKSGKHKRNDPFEQGFVTENGHFFTREEAKDHAYRTGQLNPKHHTGTLYSEDLWPKVDKEPA